MCDWEEACLNLIDDSWFGVLIEIVLFFYCFVGLAIVCDEHLVSSLETLCTKFRVPEDVAGASFMAFGSAAPEIIINAVSTLKSVAGTNQSSKGATDMGIGAILGSGMVAFALIPGCCALSADGPLLIKRRPLLRDITFYFTALVFLCIFFNDGNIGMKEAAILVSLYVLYIFMLLAAPKCRKAYQKYQGDFEERPYVSFVEEAAMRRQESLLEAAALSEERERKREEERQRALGPDGIAGLDGDEELFGLAPINEDDENFDLSTPEGRRKLRLTRGSDVLHENLHEVVDRVEQNPSGALHLLARIFSFLISPMVAAFEWTCPACEIGSPYENAWPITFMVSFGWVSVFSFLIAAIVQRWCALLGLGNNIGFFGTAVVALGAEIPDTIQSVTVASKGYGSMAVSNSMGSQICNILLGLGLPWLIANLLGGTVTVRDHKTLLSTAFIQATLVIAACVLLLGVAVARCKNKAVLNKKKGYAFLCFYVIALVVLALENFA
eukprot:g1120.t1